MKRRLVLAALMLFPVLACCEPEKKPSGDKPSPAPVEKSEKVRLKTSMGDIVLQLDSAKAPGTVENFLGYVRKKHYDGTVFHRVIDGFMIQGGGFALTGDRLVQKPTGAGIYNESMNGLKNDRGTIAMARTSDPNSATAQFFINVGDNSSLNYPKNGGYTVFGKVIAGMEVVDAIKGVATHAAGQFASDVPVTPVTILSAAAE